METTTSGHVSGKRNRAKYRPSVQELIRNALVDADGDESEAVSKLVDKALEDVDYVRELFRLAVQALNRQGRSSSRSKVRRALESTSGSVRSLGTALARPLLDFPLQDGTVLRNAYQPQVERAAAQFGHQGSTMLHLARWLQSIQAKMEGTKTVGDTLDEVSVRQLFDETQE